LFKPAANATRRLTCWITGNANEVILRSLDAIGASRARPCPRQRPPARLRLRDLVRFPRRNGRDQARVQPAREKDAVGDFGHEALLDGHFERRADEGEVDGRGGDALGVEPGGLVVALNLARARVVEVAGGKGAEVVALVVQRFELGRKVNGLGRVGGAHVQGSDADGVPRGDHAGGGDGRVEEDEAEHAVEHAAQIRPVFFVLLLV
jgi:hypothetical protein